MTSLFRNFTNNFAHFTVSNQCYFHNINNIFRLRLFKNYNLNLDLLWSFVIEPGRRKQWQAIKEVKNTPNSANRTGVDAEFHCDHGAFTRVTRLLDWRPFHYMTNINVQSFHAMPWKGPPCQGIFEFIPVDAGRTKLSFRLRSLRRDFFTMQLVRLFMKRVRDKEYDADFDRLDKILEEINVGDKHEKIKSTQDPIHI